MSPVFTYESLSSDLGTATADGLRNVANQAANFACSLWSKYTDVTAGFPDPTGVGAFHAAIYSRLCTPRNQQPTRMPEPAVIGGQCVGLPYNVTAAYSKDGVPLGTAFFPSIPGPINGVGIGSQSPGTAAYGVFAPNATAYKGILPVVSAGGANPVDSLKGYQITSVTVTPVGHSDQCGNSPPQYLTPVPSSEEFNQTNNTVNIGGGLVIAAPITIIPTLYKADVQIRPQVNVQVGPFDVTFDLGGVYIQPNFQLPSDKTVPPENSLPEPKPTPKPPASVDCPETDLSPVISRLNSLDSKVRDLAATAEDIKDCSCPVSYELASTQIGSGRSGVVALPAHTIKVRLVLTKIPDNPKKIQSGGENAPLQYFCGYYSFGDGSALGSRTALNTAASVLDCPSRATSFSWSLYAGYEGTVTAIHAVPEKQGAEFAVNQMKLAP